MNSSFWTWFIVATALALGFLLLLTASGPPQSAPSAEETVAPESAYYTPVSPPAQASAPVTGLRGGCPPPVSPYPPCPPAWPAVPPRINRSFPPCIDECSFIQLHTTVPEPISGYLRFEWLATRGRFLDPTASNPIYYAPATGFPGGEDVWIVLTVTDPSGISYTDRVKLHVRNVR